MALFESYTAWDMGVNIGGASILFSNDTGLVEQLKNGDVEFITGNFIQNGNVVDTGLVTGIVFETGDEKTVLARESVSITAGQYTAFAEANDAIGMLTYVFQGNDTIDGSSGSDILYGESGNDTINTFGGNDTVNGNQGNDVIVANPSGNPILFGGKGDDTITGNNGNDIINGNAGNDSITGGTGAKVLIDGGQGNDTIVANVASGGFTGVSGDKGNDDIFLFAAPGSYIVHFALSHGNDVVNGFREGIDIISLEGFGLKFFSDLQKLMEPDGHGNTVITFDASDSITLVGHNPQEFGLSDFVLG